MSDAPQVAEKIASLPGLRLKGLMTIGPLTEDKIQQRDAFKRLKGLFDQIQAKPFGGENFDVLSMGMSGDYEAAIEEGSTMVRIGTALFGSRA